MDLTVGFTISVVEVGGGQRVRLGTQDLNIGANYVAFTHIAGITLRGSSADSPIGAVRTLLWEMTNNSGNQTSKDAEVALGLALDGRDVADFTTDQTAPALKQHNGGGDVADADVIDK